MGNHRNLEVWQRAHRLTLDLYRCTDKFPKSELFGLVSQIRRASSSIGANLAEGCGRRRNRELARFSSIALGSANELEYHLLLARDLKFMDPEQHKDFEEQIQRIGRMLNGLVDKLRAHQEEPVR